MSGATPSRRSNPLDWALALVLGPTAVGAWLALIGAQAGQLRPGVALAGALLCGLLLVLLLLRARRAGRLEVSAWDALALAAVLVLFWRAQPTASPWPVYLDASWYLNTAARIAREGDLRFEAPALTRIEAPALRRLLVASFADQRDAGLPFMPDPTQGFFAQAFTWQARGDPETVGPYHPPFFAAALAWPASWSGMADLSRGALPWALAWLLATAALARQSFGPRAGPLAAIFAGAGPLFAYYGSQPYAELAAGAALLAGLLCLSRLDGDSRAVPTLAALAGLCLGLATLIKLDLLPALVLALTWWLLRRRSAGGTGEGLALLLGLAPPLLQGLLLAGGVSALYYRLNLGGVWRQFRGAAVAWAPSAVLAAGLAALAFALWRSRPPGRRPRLPALPGLWASSLVLLLSLAGLRGLWRPESQAPAMIEVLMWAATPLGLWAAAAGLLLALERPELRRAPVIALALTALPAVLVAPLVSRGLSSLYAARRLLPLAWPLVALLAAGAILTLLRSREEDGGGWLSGLPPSPRARRLVALAASLLIVLAGLDRARPLAAGSASDFAGGPQLAARLAEQAGPEDLLLFGSTLEGGSAGRLAASTWILEGRTVAQLGPPRPDPDALSRLIAAWHSGGGEVILVADAGPDPPSAAGWRWIEVDRIGAVSQAPAPDPTLPPRLAPLPIELVIYRLEAEGGA